MDFGPWVPDLVPYNHEGLTVARNVYAAPNGYKPMKQLSAVTSALPATWRGGGSFIGLDGTTATLAGTDGGMYAYAGSWSLKASGTYSAKWAFAQFGAFVIGVNGGTPVKYTISTATGATLGGSPPSATQIAIVRDFVFLAGNPSAQSTVYWSDINNAEAWTIGSGQCDLQQLPDGGPITGIAGGEYGLVFQENGIHRFSYVGTPLVFQRDKVSTGIGCITPGAVAQFGRMVFFLSSRGFYSFIDGQLAPIGLNKVDQTFWTTYQRSDVQNNIRATIDPKRSLVIWSMPDRLWIYNWDLDRWTDAALPGVIGISTGINAGVSIDGLDAIYPSGLDSVPYSLDDPIFQGGDPLLTLVKSDNIVYSLGSTNLEATITFAKLEPIKSRTARIRRGRLNSDAVSDVTLGIGYSQRLGDAQGSVSTTTLTAGGYMPIRVAGQYIQPTVIFNAGAVWTYASGLTFDMMAGGNG